MAVYLTCTRTRGQQKKHIDICHRCDARNSCRPYQAHIAGCPPAVGDEALESGEMPPAGRASITDVIGALKEIRSLLAATGRPEELDQTKFIPDSHPAQISIGYLIQELEKIKSLYKTSSTG